MIYQLILQKTFSKDGWIVIAKVLRYAKDNLNIYNVKNEMKSLELLEYSLLKLLNHRQLSIDKNMLSCFSYGILSSLGK